MTARLITPRSPHHLETVVDALDLVALFIGDPPADSVVCVLLDAAGAVTSALVVDGLPTPDAPVDLLEAVVAPVLAGSEAPEFDSVVVASVRSVGRAGVDDDLERWCRLDDLCASVGAELLEWLVISPGRVVLPRERLGVPSRWPSGRSA